MLYLGTNLILQLARRKPTPQQRLSGTRQITPFLLLISIHAVQPPKPKSVASFSHQNPAPFHWHSGFPKGANRWEQISLHRRKRTAQNPHSQEPQQNQVLPPLMLFFLVPKNCSRRRVLPNAVIDKSILDVEPRIQPILYRTLLRATGQRKSEKRRNAETGIPIGIPVDNRIYRSWSGIPSTRVEIFNSINFLLVDGHV